MAVVAGPFDAFVLERRKVPLWQEGAITSCRGFFSSNSLGV
jgi:hypothetical protein